MNAAWVAGSVRARLVLGRRAGSALALQVADVPSLAATAAMLDGTLYEGAVAAGATLEQAQRAVATRALMEIRVLGAWLPRAAVACLRALTAWFEIANLEDRLAYLAGAEAPVPFELGVLASVWDAAAAAAQDASELRSALAASVWGDPGGDDAHEIELALRVGWARRVEEQAPEAGAWAAGAAALLLARERFVAGRPVDASLVRRAQLGAAAAEAASLAELRSLLPRRAAWALERVETPDELWRAEVAWLRTVAVEAERLARGGLAGRSVAIGAVALLGIDAVRVATALAVATQAGAPAAREVLDALC